MTRGIGSWLLLFSLMCLSGQTALASEPDVQEGSSAGLHVTPYGMFFSRYEMRRNYALYLPAGHGEDAVRYRTRLGAVAEPVSVARRVNVGFHAAAQAAGWWETGGDTLDHPQLSLSEGKIDLHIAGTHLEVGRFAMTYGDEMLIGPVDWNPFSRAFDGLRSSTPLLAGRARFDAFLTTLDDSWATPETGETFAEGDVVFSGLYSRWGQLHSASTEIDVYVLNRTFAAIETGELSHPGASEFTLGTREKFRTGPVDLRLETGVQLGSRAYPSRVDAHQITAWHADAEVGFHLAGDRLRVGLHGLRASADNPETEDVDEGWSQLYPTAHRFLGHMNIVPGRNNIQAGTLHLSSRINGQHSMFVDVHSFSLVRPAADNDARHLGEEVNVGAMQRLGRGLSFRQEVGLFWPGAASTLEETAYWAEVELRLSFPLPVQ